MTREKKIEALAHEHDAECWRIAPYKEVSNGDSFQQGILAGIALRDAELLAMEFDEPYVDERGDEKYIAGYTEGARWQFEQMLKAIKGDGDESTSSNLR